MPSKTIKQILNDNYWRGFQWHKRPDNDSDPDFAIETSLKDIESLVNEVIGERERDYFGLNGNLNVVKRQNYRNALKKEQRERLTKLLGEGK